MPEQEKNLPTAAGSYDTLRARADAAYAKPRNDDGRQKALNLCLQMVAMRPEDEWALDRVGCCYEYGVGTEKKPAEAVFWYELAAKNGSYHAVTRLEELYGAAGRDKLFGLVAAVAEKDTGSAKFCLYACYSNGIAAERDAGKAVRCLDEAVEKRYLPAIREKGCLLYSGDYGVEKDLDKAIRLWTEAAEQGDADSAYLLGLYFEDGPDGKRDLQKAVSWFEKAMEAGSVSAAVKLGRLYDGGAAGVDYGRAFDCYKMAADRGSAEASFYLGTLYFEGKGMERDCGHAFSCWLMGAELGDDKYAADCAMHVGLCYMTGEGAKKDATSARLWLEKAEELGSAPALVELGRLYDQDGASNLAYAKAKEYYQRALDSGVAHAAVCLGDLYGSGRGIPKDMARAFELYQLAAEKGDIAALLALSTCYYDGSGTDRDYDKAVECLENAAKMGEAKAETMLRSLLSSPEEIGKNPEKAFAHNLRRAEKGDPASAFQVYLAYDTGVGVEKDTKMAADWCRQAADRGDMRAAAISGRKCLSEDVMKAVRYFEQASRQGHSGAMSELAALYRSGQGELKADKRRAFLWFEIAADLGDNTARCGLADMLASGDGGEADPERAKALYQTVIEEHDPDTYEIARLALSRL